MPLKLIESPMKNPFYKEDSGCRPETDEEKAVGIEIEHEHQPTLNKIKEYYEENKAFPDIDLVADWIHIDHINEYQLYYSDEFGLPNLERILETKCGNPAEEPKGEIK